MNPSLRSAGDLLAPQPLLARLARSLEHQSVLLVSGMDVGMRLVHVAEIRMIDSVMAISPTACASTGPFSTSLRALVMRAQARKERPLTCCPTGHLYGSTSLPNEPWTPDAELVGRDHVLVAQRLPSSTRIRVALVRQASPHGSERRRAFKDSWASSILELLSCDSDFALTCWNCGELFSPAPDITLLEIITIASLMASGSAAWNFVRCHGR